MKANILSLLCGLALLILGAALFESILFTKQAGKIQKMNQEAQTLMLPADNQKQKAVTTIYKPEN